MIKLKKKCHLHNFPIVERHLYNSVVVVFRNFLDWKGLFFFFFFFFFWNLVRIKRKEKLCQISTIVKSWKGDVEKLIIMRRCSKCFGDWWENIYSANSIVSPCSESNIV